MTIISIDDNLNIDKDHFKSLDEFMEYIVQQNILTAQEHLVKEEAIKYGNKSDEKAQLEQLSFIIEQLKQVKDFRLMERIKDIILNHQLEEEQENINIPKAHQELVMSRFEKVKKDTGRLLDWEEAKNKLKA